jgi:hypothetical protein
MDMQDGKNYRAPDGRVFTANRENRRHSSVAGWTFIPPSLKSNRSWRDSLEQLLFSEDGKILYFDLSGTVPRCVDTGWSAADFTPENSD